MYRHPFAPFVIVAPVLNNSVFIFIPIQQLYFLLNHFKAQSIESPPPPAPLNFCLDFVATADQYHLSERPIREAKYSFLITKISVLTFFLFI